MYEQTKICSSKQAASQSDLLPSWYYVLIASCTWFCIPSYPAFQRDTEKLEMSQGTRLIHMNLLYNIIYIGVIWVRLHTHKPIINLLMTSFFTMRNAISPKLLNLLVRCERAFIIHYWPKLTAHWHPMVNQLGYHFKPSRLKQTLECRSVFKGALPFNEILGTLIQLL